MSAASPQNDPLIGQIVAGRYKVLRRIGKGGMGAIYEVEHQKMRRNFAMKVLAQALTENQEAMARFHREADVVASLRHPNIVEIIDRDTLADGSPCIIMEFLRGEDLAHRIRRGGAMSFRDIVRIIDPVLTALQVAHKAGIVHRDLKPENIFLAVDDHGDEHPKLLDFGVSKIRNSESIGTADDRLVGTPAYMSPEQANGKVKLIGPATDVWAMGTILFEMATGKQAFTASSTPAVLYRICFEAPDDLIQLRPDAPPAFLQLVLQALSREPSIRIKDIHTLRAGLRDAFGAATGTLGAPLRAEPKSASTMEIEADQVIQGGTIAPGAQRVTTFSRATGQVTDGVLKPRASIRTIAIGATALVAVAAAALIGSTMRPKQSKPIEVMPVAVPVGPSEPIDRLPTPVPPKTISLVGLPKNARVMLDDQLIPGDSLSFADGKPHKLHISAPGFVDDERIVNSQTGSALELALKRRPTAPKHEHHPSTKPKPSDPLLDL